jgi:GR25 family glycosyltransferase involved in LPS biosynthesis
VKDAGYTNAQRFRATDAKAVDIHQEWLKHYKYYEYKAGKKMSKNIGERGCFISWLSILQKIIFEKIPIATVFEDDVIFHDQYKNLAEEYYNETPSDFDMIYLGYIYVFAWGADKINAAPSWCTHAILLSQKGAQTLYNLLTSQKELYALDELLMDYQYKGVDCPFKHYCWNYRSSKYYMTGFKGLVYQDQKTFGTTIQGLAGY